MPYEKFKDAFHPPAVDEDAIRTNLGLEGSIRSRSALLAAIAERVELDDEDEKALTVARLRELPPEVIDDMITLLHGKARSAGERELVLRAIEARFNVRPEREGTVDGAPIAWSTKATPRLYNLLRVLPTEHVEGNDSLDTIRRTKNWATSDYNPGSHQITLQIPRTGLLALPDISYFPNGRRRVLNQFDMATLHEIGHAVDEKGRFMTARAGDAVFGGWRTHTTREMLHIVNQAYKVYDAIDGCPTHVVDLYLKQVMGATEDTNATVTGFLDLIWPTLSTDLLERDAGILHASQAREAWKTTPPERSEMLAVRQAAIDMSTIPSSLRSHVVLPLLDEILEHDTDPADAIRALVGTSETPPTPADVASTLKKHDAVKWLTAIRLTGEDTGLWDNGKGARKHALNGRIYHETYKGEWVSYEPASLEKAVSTYQFRSPAEWFAELYAVYFRGVLPESHPDHSWMRDNFDTEDGDDVDP